MSQIPTFTYVLDAIGAFGVIVGGFVASRSTYTRQNSKDAAILISTLSKRIDVLEDQKELDDASKQQMQSQINMLEGQLKTYRELSLVKPEIITQLLATQTAILRVLTKDGIKMVHTKKGKK